jgi:hypothetical protein
VVLGCAFGSSARVGNVSSSGSAMWCSDVVHPLRPILLVDTSSGSMPLLREELLREEVCPGERERIAKEKRKKKERENMVV